MWMRFRTNRRICSLTRGGVDSIIPPMKNDRLHNRTIHPQAAVKAAPARTSLHAWCAAHPAAINVLTAVVMIPWSFYRCLTDGRTGPKRRT